MSRNNLHNYNERDPLIPLPSGNYSDSEAYGGEYEIPPDYSTLLAVNNSTHPNGSQNQGIFRQDSVEDTDDDADPRYLLNDEFGDFRGGQYNKVVRTGRQRKKLAARSKGGEFQSRRRKKRVYFCCVSSDIDIQKLFDELARSDMFFNGWKYSLHNEVLHLYKSRTSAEMKIDFRKNALDVNADTRGYNSYEGGSYTSAAMDPSPRSNTGSYPNRNPTNFSDNVDNNTVVGIKNPDYIGQELQPLQADDNQFSISAFGSQEVFVFDFGAVVFWGFIPGEEENFLRTIRMFVTKGMVGEQEFKSGEDDMAFVTTSEAKHISVANDMIVLPEPSVAKQRLAISFAIAQSSVLSIFEARVEKKVEDYKYIPEALSADGKVHLTERQLGMMIGDVFVIRHDANLHTEILDTPDFFWNDEKYEGDYRLMMGYLEMSGRTEILNKRLDMLRELLDVLQQQMENAHAVQLEWIVIYLILAEVVLQFLAIWASGDGTIV